jgi:sugar transferase (PEP-CTERM/EpsH1 system associated)
MKILYLCQRVPYPPNKGEKIRAYHHLTELARRHEIHLLCLADSRADLEYVTFLRERCASVDVVYHSPYAAGMLALGALASSRPLSVAAFDSRAFRGLVGDRLRDVRPDLIYAYSSAMAQYLEATPGVPRVIDFVDADSEKWRAYGRIRSFPQSALFTLEAERLARYEGRVAAAFDASIFVSEAEAEIVRRRAPGRVLTVIPNGVDLDAFRPAPDPERPREPLIVFTGVMGYYPNVDAVTYFARDVLPRVRSRVPAARFAIVGRDPTGTVRRLARLPGVVVTGTVPDVRPYLADAAMAVAPFRIARGVQNKVLEAMASGLPVVGTSMAFQALAAREEDGIRMADTPERLAEAVIALLSDARDRQACGRRARLYVERHHRWDLLGAQLESFLATLTGAARSAAR